MEKTDCSAALRFGVICPSDVAFRRFMPALTKVKGACFAGIGVNSIEERFGHIVSDRAAAEAKIDQDHRYGRPEQILESILRFLLHTHKGSGKLSNNG